MPDETRLPTLDVLADLPQADFVARWRSLVGEPPAIMLESRSEMIRLLVDSTEPAPFRFDEQAVNAPQVIRTGAEKERPRKLERRCAYIRRHPHPGIVAATDQATGSRSACPSDGGIMVNNQ
ncbi:hypothetical protein [Methylorubrum extorquens]|uniref:hypothetical protein n=1 Tax=Methylorubrum extorquens TaxID=408 RepID=UPI001FEEA34C|nr:hypothetical protein [Methylorubrum extorquens]